MGGDRIGRCTGAGVLGLDEANLPVAPHLRDNTSSMCSCSSSCTSSRRRDAAPPSGSAAGRSELTTAAGAGAGGGGVGGVGARGIFVWRDA